MTVSWRRSASRGGGRTGRRPAPWRLIARGDRGAQALAVAEQRDAELLQVGVVELRQQVGGDALRGERWRVLAQAQGLKPLRDVVVRTGCVIVAHDAAIGCRACPPRLGSRDGRARPRSRPQRAGRDGPARARSKPCSPPGRHRPAALDELIDTYQTRIGPRNGAPSSPAPGPTRRFATGCCATRRRRSVRSATGTSGRAHGRRREHAGAAPHGRLHAVQLLPWPVLGLPPTWYKSAAYRSRAVRDPRGVLADFGVTLPRRRRSASGTRPPRCAYLVIPQRPEGSEGFSEDELAALVTRDSMIGTGLALAPGQEGTVKPMAYVTHADLGECPARSGDSRARGRTSSTRRGSRACWP